MKTTCLTVAFAILMSVSTYAAEKHPSESDMAFLRNIAASRSDSDSISSSVAAGVDSVARPSGRQSVGLVLSGGGAKGIAHVGVIKALEENDIPVDYVTGTSMGAIVGSLYSCGWSPEKMMEFFTSTDFHYWSTGTINPDDTYFFNRKRSTPQWLSVNINLSDSTSVTEIIPTSLISPLPMNMEFLKLYSPYTEQIKENFNNLMVPFRCVTSDVYHKHKIVLRDGSLGDAVRASMSFPLVFKPIKINGILVYDGGIYDNFPVDVMKKDFHPDFMIGVSVSSPDSKPKEGDIYSQLEDMIIQNNDYSLPASEGVKIQVPVLQFGVLDFGQARTIYEIGYKTGLAMVDSIKKRCSARVPLEEVTRRREKFASATPEVIFDSVKVTGTDKKGEARYLKFLFDRGIDRPFGMQQTQDAYYRAVTGGKLSDLLPQAIFGKNGRNTLLLEANLKKPWSVGVGGWVTTSTNSLMYLTAGYHTLSFNSLDIDLSGWIGQTYWAAMLSARFTMPSFVPSYMELEAVVSRQKFFDSELLFYQNSTPTFITETDNFARLRYCFAIGRRAEGYASMGAGYISDSYYPDNTVDFVNTPKDKTKYRVAAFKTGIRRGTLNNELYPSSGMSFDANVLLSYEQNKFVDGSAKTETPYRNQFRGSLEILWRHYYPVHKNFSVGGMANFLGTLQDIKKNYTATLVHAAAFSPTPSTRYYFNEAFRSDNYVAAGITPIWLPASRLQLRGDFYVFSPIRNLVREENGMAKYQGWFKRTEFIGEVAAVYNFPFASLSLYCNYLSSPARNWNFGINFGLLFHAPKLLR